MQDADVRVDQTRQGFKKPVFLLLLQVEDCGYHDAEEGVTLAELDAR